MLRLTLDIIKTDTYCLILSSNSTKFAVSIQEAEKVERIQSLFKLCPTSLLLHIVGSWNTTIVMKKRENSYQLPSEATLHCTVKSNSFFALQFNMLKLEPRPPSEERGRTCTSHRANLFESRIGFELTLKFGIDGIADCFRTLV